jgi:hypothetical protein
MQSRLTMRHEGGHYSDEVLLLVLDDEFPARRQASVQSHLVVCSACRARFEAIQAEIEQFNATYRSLDRLVPPQRFSRAMLQARLAELAATPLRGRMDRMLQSVIFWRRWVYLGAAVLIATVCVALVPLAFGPVWAAQTPDGKLTPGLTLSVSVKDVCSNALKDAPDVPAQVAYEVFTQYGIRDPRPRAYEMDYLITPALGGAIDIRNLWPQPYSAGTWNAHVKDALEDHLYDLVCKGAVELTTAQRDIATNWIAAYQKYFHTEDPLPDHLGFYKDRPWE